MFKGIGLVFIPIFIATSLIFCCVCCFCLICCGCCSLLMRALHLEPHLPQEHPQPRQLMAVGSPMTQQAVAATEGSIEPRGCGPNAV